MGILALTSPGASTNLPTSNPLTKPASTFSLQSVTVASTTDSSAVITWQTDQPSTSLVEYGTDESQLILTQENVELVTDHKVLVNNLSPEKEYFYKLGL